MREEMYTHHYYKQRSIIKPNPLGEYLVQGILVSGLLFACAAIIVLLK